MNNDDFDARMRQFELLHSLRVPPETFIVLRVDGRNFHALTADMEHPFDPAFHGGMRAAAASLVTELQGIYAHSHSDEISVLLPINSEQFGRSAEKLVSLSAGIASMAFTKTLPHAAAHFDSRLVALPNVQTVVDYFSWRMADCERNCLNDWAYWSLVANYRERPDLTITPEQTATNVMRGMATSQKHELLHAYDIKFADLPGWQRNGFSVQWVTIPVQPEAGSGFPVRSGTTRRLLTLDEDLPTRDAYRDKVRATATSCIPATEEPVHARI